MSEHIIVATLRGYDSVGYEFECSDPENCGEVFTETDWPDLVTCRCKGLDCECRDGEHDSCYEYGYWIGDMGTACRMVPVEGCGLIVWFDELGEEAMSVWAGPKIRIEVTAEWEGGEGPQFTPVDPANRP